MAREAKPNYVLRRTDSDFDESSDKWSPSDMAALSWAQGHVLNHAVPGEYQLEFSGAVQQEPLFKLVKGDDGVVATVPL